MIAAVIGGILVLGGGFGLHQAGLVKLTPETDRQMSRSLSAAEKKISDLEKKLGEVSSSVSKQDASSAVSALETKVSGLEDKLETAVSSAPADVTPALDALKKDVAALKTDVAAVGGEGSGGGAPVDLTPLESRLAALEDGAKSESTVDLTPLETRLSKLENETSSSSSEADKLSGSLTGVETQVTELKSAIADVTSRLQNTEATAKSAQTAVSTSDVSLKTLADSQARATETLTSLSADIKSVGTSNSTALETLRSELDAISKRLAQVESTMGDATAREVAARALSVSALKSAVDSGRPYETELAAVKAGLPADLDLSALQANATTGVAPVSVLIAQFPPIAREIHLTFAEPNRSEDVLENLLASARSIVSVRGPGNADGTGPDAVLRRMENAVSSGDLKAALATYKDLPDNAQAVAKDWVTSAAARVEVDALTDKASQEVLNALASKDS
ncbi:MAG: mitofilin family membrane protein [Roseibium sp.]